MAEKDLEFTIGFNGIKTDNIEELWKKKEKEIQDKINKVSKIEIPINDMAIKTLNEQLRVTQSLLKNISKEQSVTRTKPATLLQATKAQGAADLNAIKLAREKAVSDDKIAISALRRAKAEANATSSTNANTRALLSQRGVLNGMPQLLNSYISILGAARIFNNIRRITSEFELQKVSLGAITRDLEFTEQLFNRIKGAAIASPFTVKELTTYTKQLAAYRIENEDLFDTMSKLADVAAGLGVDFERLTLAYGQVKSASVLRGCLGYNTEIQLFNGDVKKVQDIIVGDELINELGEKVNVLELIRGRETMFLIEHVSGRNRISYRVNRNHILTLWNVQNQNLEDIYLYDYINNTEKYLGYRIIDGKEEYYSIKVTEDKIDDYYGFVLDGNKRFRLGDGTITHNTELRQFTEAGIPLVDLLAKKFSQLRGEIVSTGDVFELISERAVPFEMIKGIFEDMTKAGGVFYQMQKKQAESLYGIWANVPDNIQLAFDKLGRENRGLLVGLGKGLTELFQNFDLVVASANRLAIMLVTIKALQIANAVATGAFTAATIAQTAAQKGLTAAIARSIIAFKGLGVAIKSVPVFGWIIAGIAALVSGITLLTKRTREANKAAEEAINKLTAQSTETKIYSDALLSLSKEQENLVKREKELRAIRDRSVEQEKELSSISSRTSNILDERGKIMAKLRDISPTFANSIQDITDNTEELSKASELYNQQLRIRLSLEQALKGDDTIKNAEKYNKAVEDTQITQAALNSTEGEAINRAKELIKERERLANLPSIDRRGKTFITSEESELLKRFIESTEPYEERLKKLVKELNNIGSANRNITKVLNLSKLLGDSDDALNDYISSILKTDKTLENFKKSFASTLEEMKGHADLKVMLASLGDTNIPKEEKIKLHNKIVDFLKSVLDDKGIIGEIRPVAEKMISEALNINLNKVSLPKNFNIWQKLLKDSGQYQDTEIENFSSLEAAGKDVAEQYRKLSEQIKLYTAASSKGSVANEEAQKKVEQLTSKQKALLNILKQLNLTYLISNKTKTDTFQAQLDTLKSAYKEYQDLQKLMSDDKAKKQVKQVYGFEIDDTSYRAGLEKIQKSYEKIGQSAKAAKVGNAIFEFDANQVEKSIKDELDKIKKLIDNQTKAQDFYEKVLGFTGDEKLAKDLTMKISSINFDINPRIREQLVQNLENTIKELNINAEIVVDGEVNVSEIGKLLEGMDLGAEQKKILEESFNALVEYDQKSITTLLSSLSKYEDVEKRKTDVIKKNEELRQKAREQGLNNLIDNIDKKQKAELDAIDLEQFKKDIDWGSLFGDLDKLSTISIDSTISQIESMKQQIQDTQSIQSIKELEDAIMKLKEEMIDRDPFTAIKLGWKDMSDGLKDINTIQDKLKPLEDKLKTEGLSGDEIEKYEELMKLLAVASNKAKNGIDLLKKGFQSLSGKMSSMESGMNSIADFFTDILGENEFSKRLKDFAKGFGIVAAVLGVVATAFKIAAAAAAIFGTVVNTIMPYMWILVAVAAAIGAVIAAMKAKLRALEEQQDIQKEKLKELENAYNDLNRAMDKALGEEQLEYYRESIKNIEAQIKATQKLIDLEKQKKDKDQNKEDLSEWERDLEEFTQKMEDSLEKMQEYLLGSSLTSAAEQFAQSWLDAYLSFEDTKAALEGSFEDMLKNLIVKSVLAKTMEKALTGIYEAAAGYIEGKIGLDELMKEISIVMEQVPQLDSLMRGLYEGLGINLQQAGQLGGMALGISQASEDAINAVTGAVNTAVYYLAMIYERIISGNNTQVTLNSLLSVQNAALVELKAINENTSKSAKTASDIYEILDSVTREGGSRKINTNI